MGRLGTVAQACYTTPKAPPAARLLITCLHPAPPCIPILQKFIEFTQKDLEERERKLRQAYTALAPPKRVLQSSRIEGFFERLMEDASKRRAKADKLAHDKVAKEKEILASSVMYGRPRSAR